MTRRLRLLPAALVLAASCLGMEARAQVVAADDPLAGFTFEDITESLLSLGSFGVSPGVAGARITSEDEDVPYDIARGTIEIPLWFETPVEWLDVFAEVGYGSVRLDTRYSFENTAGETVDVESEVTVRTGRIGLGIELEPLEQLFVTPFVLGAISGVSSDTGLSGGFVDPAQMTPTEELLLLDWSVNAATVAGVVDVQYLPWVVDEVHRVDLTLRYAALWSKSFNESLEGGSASALRHNITAETMWHVVTRWRLLERRLSPNVFVNATTFPGQDREDLGFNAYFGIGAGIDLYSSRPIFGVLRRDFIGVRGAAVVGKGARGWSVVASIRR